MIKEKYAIRFPDMQNIERSSSASIFSETSIIETKNTFLKTFDALEGLTGLILQKARTHETSKQLNMQRVALDEEIENQKEQKRIEFEEYAERLQIQLKFEKEKMDMELKKMALEISEKVNQFSCSVEENIRSNQIFLRIIKNEQSTLEYIQPFIEFLAEDYSQRREYVLYCEMQRKSLQLVNLYLREMV